MKAIGLFLFCAVAFADTDCGPSYERLVDPRGNTLPLETPFIASVEIASKTAMVFRPIEGDILALITRSGKRWHTRSAEVNRAYWQDGQCRESIDDRDRTARIPIAGEPR